MLARALGRGVWRARPAAELVAVAESSGVRRVFLFVGDALQSGDAVTRDSVSALHSLDIEPHALRRWRQAGMAAALDEVDAMARRLCPTYRGISVEDLDGWLALGP